MLFALQETISTMGNKNILLYFPTEGQKTIIFFSFSLNIVQKLWEAISLQS